MDNKIVEACFTTLMEANIALAKLEILLKQIPVRRTCTNCHGQGTVAEKGEDQSQITYMMCPVCKNHDSPRDEVASELTLVDLISMMTERLRIMNLPSQNNLRMY